MFRPLTVLSAATVATTALLLAGAAAAQDSAPAESPAAKKGTKRTLTGRVTSTKMMKTVTVLVERRVKHAVYGKYIVQSTKYHAHCETPVAEGDLVEIQESRPISKTKAWVVTRKVDSIG